MLAPIDTRLMALLSLPRNAVGAEIGVHEGAFSREIVRIAQPKRLYLIDPWLLFPGETYADSWYGTRRATQDIMDARHAHVAATFQRQIEAGSVRILRALSVDAALMIADDELDFVYVDGDHSYEGVTADLSAYGPKLKVGGLLVADDYMLGSWWKDGVVRAVNDLIGRGQYAIEFKMGSQIALRKLTG
ncbi:class I SAM-dependent methyltransferase [Chthonobacter rhizosphaerae]|uniref:class I SAM-dependent methyltransferase n=1 Tax=Chthonobacter rhizosphaerae TaxID=2735553 RepID=UPI0015EFD096|nr:class I SAM-dependent methyltransferase [Chthonobacter rhizosphaerae]